MLTFNNEHSNVAMPPTATIQNVKQNLMTLNDKLNRP